MSPTMRQPDYLRTLADGTVKQLNPFTGTEVWTVPGRSHRPLWTAPSDPAPLDPGRHGRHCPFCELRYLETPPEKSRVIRTSGGWEQHDWTPANQLFDTVAEFRRVPNLFEIVGFDYWRDNFGYSLPPTVARTREAYLAEPEGLRHVLDVVAARLRASGMAADEVERMPVAERAALADAFFGGGHELIIARRHFTDGATDESQLAGAGTLDVDEHRRYVALTVDSIRRIYDTNRYARYVVAFQNWLKPAGASFDHLHKQLVAIDERGTQQEAALARLREDPNIFNEVAANYAGQHNLHIAANDHAIAFAGFGHRYPTIEVYSRSEHSNPWEHEPEELDGVADVLHAVHAATGPDVPCNEEWHYRPIDVTVGMPWRIMVKWRVSTLAGFEGATKIYVNTVTPATIRDRMVGALTTLRGIGHIAGGLRIGDEVDVRPNPLRYRA